VEKAAGDQFDMPTAKSSDFDRGRHIPDVNIQRAIPVPRITQHLLPPLTEKILRKRLLFW
jgi:hypothetical protein